MKKILIIALTLIAFAAKAQTPATTEVSKATVTVQTNDNETTQAPVVVPATEDQTPAAPTAGSAPSISANYVGTNDLNLLLLRQGVKRA